MWKQKWMGGGVLHGNRDQVPLSLQTWTCWGINWGGRPVFVFWTVANILPKILQDTACAVSKLKVWVRLGDSLLFNTLPTSGDCFYFVCHMPTAADPRILCAPCETGAVPRIPPTRTSYLIVFSKEWIISSKALTYLKTSPFVALTPSHPISKEVVGLFLRTAEISGCTFQI